MLNIVLFEPEIPANTGTIGRSCVLTDSRLHLIEPLGFSLDDRMIRRAGMGYWHDLDVTTYPSWEAFTAAHPGARMWFLSARAARSYAQVDYRDEDFLVFRCERCALPDELLAQHAENGLRIPQLVREGLTPATSHGPASDPADPAAVSLNLSNAANIVLFEALRQLGFPGLEADGTHPL